MIVKGGFIAWSVMGDPNASIPTPQPVLYRPMFGSFGKAIAPTSITFMSRVSNRERRCSRQTRPATPDRAGTKNCRRIGKKDMIHNDAMPKLEVDPETYEVRVDGAAITCEPARVLPLAQRYFLF